MQERVVSCIATAKACTDWNQRIELQAEALKKHLVLLGFVFCFVFFPILQKAVFHKEWLWPMMVLEEPRTISYLTQLCTMNFFNKDEL